MKNTVLAASMLFASGAVLASGGSSVPEPRGSSGPNSTAPEAHELTPEHEATIAYNDGLKRQEKADALRKDAAAETDNAKKHDKLSARAQKEYANALDHYQEAAKKNPKMFQAFGGIGYAQRNLGDYDAALTAYDRALQLEPRYTPAIEYRAEAYLGLNRIDEVKAAYTALFAGDRKRADELHAAMKAWVEGRRKDPAGVSAERIEEFATWVAQREEIAGQTSAAVPSNPNRW